MEKGEVQKKRPTSQTNLVLIMAVFLACLILSVLYLLFILVLLFSTAHIASENGIIILFVGLLSIIGYLYFNRIRKKENIPNSLHGLSYITSIFLGFMFAGLIIIALVIISPPSPPSSNLGYVVWSTDPALEPDGDMKNGTSYDIMFYAYDTNGYILSGVSITLEGPGYQAKTLKTGDGGTVTFNDVQPLLGPNKTTGEMQITAKYTGTIPLTKTYTIPITK